MFNEDKINDIITKLNDGNHVPYSMDKIYAVVFLYVEVITDIKERGERIPSTTIVTVDKINSFAFSNYMYAFIEVFDYFHMKLKTFEHDTHDESQEIFTLKSSIGDWKVIFTTTHTSSFDSITIYGDENNHLRDEIIIVNNRLGVDAVDSLFPSFNHLQRKMMVEPPKRKSAREIQLRTLCNSGTLLLNRKPMMIDTA